jgi:hypothetical protein
LNAIPRFKVPQAGRLERIAGLTNGDGPLVTHSSPI